MSEGREGLRAELDACEPDVRARFFAAVVEATEPRIAPEMIELVLEYSSRVRLRIAYHATMIEELTLQRCETWAWRCARPTRVSADCRSPSGTRHSTFAGT